MAVRTFLRETKQKTKPYFITSNKATGAEQWAMNKLPSKHTPVQG